MKILVINGPNLNMLGDRQVDVYGYQTLDEINDRIKAKAQELKVDVELFQSNSEGALIDFIQGTNADGIIINPGAFTHYGLSLRDCLSAKSMPIIEVHLSNIYAREEWRQKSVISPISYGQIVGLGWRGYIVALDIIVDILKEKG